MTACAKLPVPVVMMWGLAAASFMKPVASGISRDPHKILHSPLVRTTQTAELIAAAFTHASMAADKALQPGSSVSAVDEAVSAFIDADVIQHLLLVSHQPLVSRVVEHYVGPGSYVPFLTPGGLVTLSLESSQPACAHLLFWALPPEYEAGG